MFEIHLGIPEMEELWNNLQKKHQDGTATKKEEKLRKQMGKAMALLSSNPRHPGLHSDDISSLTARYGLKVWVSYLENDTSLIMKLPDWLSNLLLDRAGLCLGEKNKRHMALRWIQRAMWMDGIGKANEYLMQRGFEPLHIG